VTLLREVEIEIANGGGIRSRRPSRLWNFNREAPALAKHRIG
jgi:hypothetical protein